VAETGAGVQFEFMEWTPGGLRAALSVFFLFAKTGRASGAVVSPAAVSFSSERAARGGPNENFVLVSA